MPEDRARIVVMAGNFHGRTTTIVGFSDGPGRPRRVRPVHARLRRGAVRRRRRAGAPRSRRTPSRCCSSRSRARPASSSRRRATCADVRRICDRARRADRRRRDPVGARAHRAPVACEREGVDPDVYLLGKALGGGIVPVSAVVARRRRCSACCAPGQHGSTFGGNPLACAVGRAVVELLATGEYQRRARELGRDAGGAARRAGRARRGRGARRPGCGPGSTSTRGWAPVARSASAWSRRGVLAKDTHGSTIRLAPPLVATVDEIALAVDALAGVLAELG